MPLGANPGHYIVTVVSGVPLPTIIDRYKITPLITFDGDYGATYGFGVKLSDKVRQEMEADPEIAAVERDVIGGIDPPLEIPNDDPINPNGGAEPSPGSVLGPGYYYLKSTRNQQYLTFRMKNGQPVLTQSPDLPTFPWEIAPESAGSDTFTLNSRNNYLRMFGSPRNASVECEIQAPDDPFPEKIALFRIESEADPEGGLRYMFEMAKYKSDSWLLGISPFAIVAPAGGDPRTQVGRWKVIKWVPPLKPW
ncbi:hypothetical protein B0H14DRAFT_3031130 [Mycena olivaceomarginata]|nr:hypothetical protein B0H14DRAFT_3031130 [Mycena olivaceomarginata]